MPARKKPAKSAPGGRKPSAASRTFDDLIAPHAAPVRESAAALRRLVFEVAPQAAEGIYGGAKVGLALYSMGTKAICGIQPVGNHCLFYVHHVTPEDTGELALEGKGKGNRHIKFSGPDEVRPDAVGALLQLALQRMIAGGTG